MNETKRLTSADLAEIKKRSDSVIENTEWQWGTLSKLIEEDVPALLAEVELLREVLSHINDLSDDFFTEVDADNVWSIPDSERHKSIMQEIFVLSYEAVNEDD